MTERERLIAGIEQEIVNKEQRIVVTRRLIHDWSQTSTREGAFMAGRFRDETESVTQDVALLQSVIAALRAPVQGQHPAQANPAGSRICPAMLSRACHVNEAHVGANCRTERTPPLRAPAPDAALSGVPAEMRGWQSIVTAPKGSWPDGPKDTTDPAYVEPPKLWLDLGDGLYCVGYFDAYYAEGGNGFDGAPPWVEQFSGERIRPHRWMTFDAALTAHETS